MRLDRYYFFDEHSFSLVSSSFGSKNELEVYFTMAVVVAHKQLARYRYLLSFRHVSPCIQALAVTMVQLHGSSYS